MAEYIEREGLLENLEERLSDLRFIVKYEKRHGSVSDEEKAKAKLEKLNEVINLIKSQPTADVPEVVRCGLCKHYKLRGGSKWCVLHMIRMHSDDYCSYGAKMDKE